MSDEITFDEYLPTIDAILGVADFQHITVKKIRNALQELFGVNLSEQKKEINNFILSRYYAMEDKREEEKERLARIEKEDRILAAKLSNVPVSGPLPRARRVKSKQLAPKQGKERAPSNTGFNKPMALSHELGAFLGSDRESRPQIVKKLWAYIKENNLQNPDDKRQIICNDELQTVFKKKTVGAFEMNKILSKHIFNPDEVGGETKVKDSPEDNIGKKRTRDEFEEDNDEVESDISEA